MFTLRLPQMNSIDLDLVKVVEYIVESGLYRLGIIKIYYLYAKNSYCRL